MLSFEAETAEMKNDKVILRIASWEEKFADLSLRNVWDRFCFVLRRISARNELSNLEQRPLFLTERFFSLLDYVLLDILETFFAKEKCGRIEAGSVPVQKTG